ncbi:thioredoxin [bacterium]|nr:thioredoxin [bacterium]
MENESALKLTDEDFEEKVIKSDIPVLVDFWASWCGPCKMISPIIDELAKEYAGTVKVASMNVDENMETPNNYNIRSIPTLILFKDGVEQDRMVGAVPKYSLEEMIKKAL